MMNELKTPWERRGGMTPKYQCIIDAFGRYVVHRFPDHLADAEISPENSYPYEEVSKRIDGIVRAVNSHQAMKEALEAIIARIDGAFDHPSLLKQGPLSIGHNDDVRKIAKKAITLANGGTPDV